MEAGAHQGSLMAESEAMSPEAIEEGRWHVHDSSEWSAPAPTVRVQVCAPEERDAKQRSIEAALQLAVAAAEKAVTIVIEGVSEGAEYDDSMGRYVLEREMVVNGRGTWKLEEAPVEAGDAENEGAPAEAGNAAEDEGPPAEASDAAEDEDEEQDEDDGTFLYYASSSREWFISLQANALTGDPIGWLRSRDSDTTALTPAQLGSRTWQIYDVESESWSDAPTVRAYLALDNA